MQRGKNLKKSNFVSYS